MVNEKNEKEKQKVGEPRGPRPIAHPYPPIRQRFRPAGRAGCANQPAVRKTSPLLHDYVHR